MIEQYRYNQRQRFMSVIQMALHRSNGVTHHSEGHIRIRRALMFDDNIDIAFSRRGFQCPKNIGVVCPQVLLNKAPGFKRQRIQVAKLSERRRKMDIQKVARGISLT